MRPLLWAALAALTPAAAAAQDCSNPITQIQMTQCAAAAFQAADGDLNHAYKLAMGAARDMDQYLQPGQTPAATMLRDAQRAWIPFRDQACATESLLMRGGSMQPQLEYMCLERLTRQRTEDLRFFGEVN